MRAEQSLQSQICGYIKLQYPKVIFKVDHGASQHKQSYIERNIYQKQQYKAGFPDFQIIKASGKWHGLFLELKKSREEIFYKGTDNLKPGTDDHFVHQYNFIRELINNGFYASFVWSFDISKQLIDDYLKGVISEPIELKFGKESFSDKTDILADQFLNQFGV